MPFTPTSRTSGFAVSSSAIIMYVVMWPSFRLLCYRSSYLLPALFSLLDVPFQPSKGIVGECRELRITTPTSSSISSSVIWVSGNPASCTNSPRKNLWLIAHTRLESNSAPVLLRSADRKSNYKSGTQLDKRGFVP